MGRVRGNSKERLLLALKMKGPQTAAALARRMGVTSTAVRQHLADLQADRLVSFEGERGKVGRPRRVWRVAETPEAQARFPDSHAELTVGIIAAARDAFGEEGLDRLIERRGELQAEQYAQGIPRDGSLEQRVGALARIRREEGYMAEWKRQPDGSFLLIENHCPICVAAESCQSLCRVEQDLFRSALGPDALVERSEHMLSGERRCVYRIESRSTTERAS